MRTQRFLNLIIPGTCTITNIAMQVRGDIQNAPTFKESKSDFHVLEKTPYVVIAVIDTSDNIDDSWHYNTTCICLFSNPVRVGYLPTGWVQDDIDEPCRSKIST